MRWIDKLLGMSSVWLVLAIGVGSWIIPGATPAGAEDGSLWTQRSIFHTKGGPKESLRETGISIDFWLTGFGQGILAGDGENGTERGNKGDLVASFNGEKLGLCPGLFVNLEFVLRCNCWSAPHAGQVLISARKNNVEEVSDADQVHT